MIPKTIIQTHESEYTFTAVAAECRKRLKEVNPDFELRFFSAAARRTFVSDRRPELLSLYDFYPNNTQKKDLFKMIAVSSLGGFFMDLSIHLEKPLTPLCSERLAFPFQKRLTPEEFEELHGRPAVDPKEYLHLGNYAFAAEAGHPFFENVIDEMIRRTEMLSGLGTSQFDITLTSGAGVINSVWNRVRGGMSDQMTIVTPEEDTNKTDGSRDWWNRFGSYGGLVQD